MLNVLASILLVFLSGTMLNIVKSDFKSEQKKQTRVKSAYTDKEAVVLEMVEQAGLDINSLNVFIRVTKKSKTLEVFGKDATSNKYVLIKTYSICASSGVPGPKRKSGDRQVPEGFYIIDRFNPWSTFHLSLGINYPNKSDKILTEHSDPGGDIFIHGDCVTIGCVPLTDDKIKELYILAVEAKNNGQNSIPVHIFPANLKRFTYSQMIPGYRTELKAFWDNLREGYMYFEKNKQIPKIHVNSNGSYVFD